LAPDFFADLAAREPPFLPPDDFFPPDFLPEDFAPPFFAVADDLRALEDLPPPDDFPPLDFGPAEEVFEPPPPPTALPAMAPITPPTTAPTGPATLPITAPVAAPAASLEMDGMGRFPDDCVLSEPWLFCSSAINL
jgi:hypothetical protein